jgi:hypothetical protein
MIAAGTHVIPEDGLDEPSPSNPSTPADPGELVAWHA